jgi:c-di-GMP-binding flagellar brake protein YcgR
MNTPKKPSFEMSYDIKELSKLRYVKVIYTGLDCRLHEIKADVKFIGDVLISLYFKRSDDFDIKCPQDVTLKFVTQDAMYLALALLQEVNKSEGMVYFSVIPPRKMIKRQNRKYSRVELDRSCVLVVNDETGKSTTYLSEAVNISASGILIKNLKTVVNDNPYESDFSKYDCFHLIICLETDMVLKLFARYVRHEFVGNTHRYAFHFLSVKPEITEQMFQYVAEEQIKQLKLMQSSKKA